MFEKPPLGERLLADHQELEVQLVTAGSDGLVSLIEACINNGWSTQEAVIAKVQQIGGPYFDQDVPRLLDLHSSPLARPQLWQLDSSGRYRTVEPSWRPESLTFWQPARQAPTPFELLTCQN